MTPSHRPLFVIGYRGTGKSTVARLLADKLGWNWLDADEVLEQRQGRTIRQIFEEDGEAAFREIEAAILADLVVMPRQVIATGGGVVLREENRQRLKDAGLVVWLTADPVTLWRRIQTDVTTAQRRPPLTGGGLQEIETLLRSREKWYAECAHLVVDTAGRLPDDVARAILDGTGIAEC